MSRSEKKIKVPDRLADKGVMNANETKKERAIMRTDEHRPSVINPADYEFVACEYVKIEDFGSAEFLKEERARIRAHMTRTGGNYSGHEHGGNCMVCGSVNAVYTMLFYHAKSNSYVRTGSDCAAKIEMSGIEEFNRFRAAVKNAIEAKAGKKKAEAILNEAGLSEAWKIYESDNRSQYEERTIGDIVSKLVTYGSISERAENFVRDLLAKIPTREARKEAERQAHADAAECPEGRIVIVGEVLATKVQDSDFGSVVKMLVRAETGFKVWGTCPAGIVRGMKISFKATVTRSNDDAKFGFFKRPSSAQVLEAPVAA